MIDVRAALAARRYYGDGTVTIAIDDPLLAGNSGHFTISGDGAEPTSRRPALHLDVAGLAAVLLGGARWRDLAMAGLARCQDPTALAVADQLFAAPEAPHAGFFF